jgi:hypothetical protein
MHFEASVELQIPWRYRGGVCTTAIGTDHIGLSPARDDAHLGGGRRGRRRLRGPVVAKGNSAAELVIWKRDNARSLGASEERASSSCVPPTIAERT